MKPMQGDFKTSENVFERSGFGEVFCPISSRSTSSMATAPLSAPKRRRRRCDMEVFGVIRLI